MKGFNDSRSAVDLLDELREFTGNVGSVAIEDGSVTSADLTGVVENDDLGVERSGLLGGVVFAVRADLEKTVSASVMLVKCSAHVSSANVLDGDVLDVEADVVSRETLRDLLVVHLDRLDFGSHVCGGKGDDHTSLDDTGLDTADRHCADTADLVDVLEGETKRLVGWALWGLDSVDGLEEGLPLGGTALGLFGPSLVPGHAKTSSANSPRSAYLLAGLLDHVVSSPTGDGHERNRLGVVADLLDEVGRLLDDLVESVLGPLASVHLVASDDDLPDTEGEGEESVLAGLTVLRDTGLELSDTGGNDKDGAVGLRGSGDHVLDKVTVTGSVDDGDHVPRGLELPQGNVDGDTTLTLGLEFVKHPSILERGWGKSSAYVRAGLVKFSAARTFAELSSLLLELLDGTLVDTTALVDQVSGGGRLSRV